MKIVHINPTAHLGSTGRICGDLAEMTLLNGDEAVIAYGRAAKIQNVPLLRIGNQTEVLLHVAATKLLDNHGLVDFGGTAKLVTWLKDFKPDVLHLHNLHGYYLDYETLFDYIKEVEVPVIWTIHDCWPFTGHCCYYERANCHKWKSECSQCPSLNLYPASLGYDGSSRNFKRKKKAFLGVPNLRLIPVSHWMSSQLKDSFLSGYPRTVIYNGVDLGVFQPNLNDTLRTKYALESKNVVLGVANEWSDGKGLWLFSRLANEHLPNLQIVLIGVSPKQKAKMPTNIIAIERTNSQRELAEWYSIADVFVTPSKAESFGMVVAEAMACGTPCVVNDKSAMSELVSDEVGVKCNDAYEEYLRGIQLVLKKGKSAYAPNCRLRATVLFDKINFLAAYQAAYNQLLSR